LFLDQRRKARDIEAKLTVVTATSALLTHLTEKDTAASWPTASKSDTAALSS